MSRCHLLVLLALELVSASCVFAQGDESEPDKLIPQTIQRKAMNLATRGDIAAAAAIMRKQIEQYPTDPNGYGLLGQFLAFDGQVEEAIQTWTIGAEKSDRKYEMWSMVAAAREQQATDGPNIIRRRGSLTAKPSRDKEADKKFKTARYRDAATAFENAHKLSPDRIEPIAGMARSLAALGQSEKAIEAWERAVTKQPNRIESWLGLVDSQISAGQLENAEKSLGKVLELNPRQVAAFNHMAKICEDSDQQEKAKAWRAKAKFYSQLPPFTKLDYSPQNHQTLNNLKELKQLEALAGDGSESSLEFLAAVCWQHPHNANEEFAFKTLDKAGEGTSPLLRNLIRHAQATCTIRSAGHILARRRDSEAFDLLMPQLRRDLRRGFEMNIAGALDSLGDPRAVPGLITSMAPTEVSQPADAHLAIVQDRAGARIRAALALGAFDTPQSKKALQSGTKNPLLAPYAHAALYRISKDQAHLEKMVAALQSKDHQAATAPPQKGENVLVVGKLKEATPAQRRLRDYLKRKADSKETRRFLSEWVSNSSTPKK